jgi:hypothetical protein
MPDFKLELTVFTKDGGPLTKTIRLGIDGKPVSDSPSKVQSRQ